MDFFNAFSGENKIHENIIKFVKKKIIKLFSNFNIIFVER
jgi:hypothetical protein